MKVDTVQKKKYLACRNYKEIKHGSNVMSLMVGKVKNSKREGR